AHFNMGNALRNKGNLNDAIAAYREAIRLDPTDDDPHNSLAWELAVGPDGVRNGKQAVEHATRACELTAWKNPGHIGPLAAAYAEMGDCETAVECKEKALAFPAFENKHGKECRERLQLYARKQPYRDPARAREVAPPPRPVKP